MWLTRSSGGRGVCLKQPPRPRERAEGLARSSTGVEFGDVNVDGTGAVLTVRGLMTSLLFSGATYVGQVPYSSKPSSGTHYLVIWSPNAIFGEMSALIAKLKDCATLNFVMKIT